MPVDIDDERMLALMLTAVRAKYKRRGVTIDDFLSLRKPEREAIAAIVKAVAYEAAQYERNRCGTIALQQCDIELQTDYSSPDSACRAIYRRITGD